MLHKLIFSRIFDIAFMFLKAPILIRILIKGFIVCDHLLICLFLS